MKKLFALSLMSLSFVAFAGVAGSYDLRTIEKRPIPKVELFKLWHGVALKQCVNAPKDKNLSEEKCRELIETRGRECQKTMESDFPEVIDNQTVSKEVGRQYLSCALPYYFCGGVEVHNEQEAREHCR